MMMFRRAKDQKLKSPFGARLPVLAVLLSYLVSSMAWLFPLQDACTTVYAVTGTVTHSCPMCKIEPSGIHHCRCCEDREQCECGLSAQGDDTQTASFPDTGILRPNPPLPPLSRSRTVLNSQIQEPVAPQSNVPTPPPEV